jgi:hypothetical protein
VVAYLAAAAALLTYTLSGILLGGLFLGFFLAIRTSKARPLWPILAAALACAAIITGLFLAFLAPLAHGWNGGEAWGAGPLESALASVSQVGWPVALLAGLGAVGAVKTLPEQGRYWATCAAAWVVASLVFPLLVVYHSAYHFPLSLGLFVLAGFFTGQVYELLCREKRALAWAWLGVVGFFNLPALVSHYSDGSRNDYRTAAQHIAAHWQPGDGVAAVGPSTLRHYGNTLPRAVGLSEANPIPQIERLGAAGDRLWLVIPSGRRGKPEDLARWLAANCRQTLTVRRPRLDYRDYITEVFLYQAGPAGAARRGQFPDVSAGRVGASDGTGSLARRKDF